MPASPSVPRLVAGASVAAEVVEQMRDDKVIAFKKRRRQNSKRKRGHRQHLTIVRIAEILTDGAKPSKAAAARRSDAPAALLAEPDAGKAGKAAKPAKSAKAEKPAAVEAPKPSAEGADEIDPGNLSLISGVGPDHREEAPQRRHPDMERHRRLDERGRRASLDEELSLRGRATREEWVSPGQGAPGRQAAARQGRQGGEGVRQGLLISPDTLTARGVDNA